MNRYYVYELRDPIIDQPFYIGKGSGQRRWQHIAEAKQPTDKQINRLKCDRINQIINIGYDIMINIIQDNLTETEALALETKLITKYGRLINNTGILTNIQLQGYGTGNTVTKRIKQYDINGNLIAIHNSLTEAAIKLNLSKSTICAALNGRTVLAGGFKWVYFGEPFIIPTYNNITTISQYDMNGNFIKNFDKLIDAATELNITYTTIVDCIQGNHHSAGGFRWCKKGSTLNPLPPNYNHSPTRRYACYDDNINLVQIFDSIKEAANSTGATPTGIVDRCAGRVRYKSGGYYWKYHD